MATSASINCLLMQTKLTIVICSFWMFCNLPVSCYKTLRFGTRECGASHAMLRKDMYSQEWPTWSFGLLIWACGSRLHQDRNTQQRNFIPYGGHKIREEEASVLTSPSMAHLTCFHKVWLRKGLYRPIAPPHVSNQIFSIWVFGIYLRY